MNSYELGKLLACKQTSDEMLDKLQLSKYLIEELEQQLAEREKQVVMLRDALDYAASTYDSVWTRGMPIICDVVDQALAATDDLSGYILCDREPVGSTKEN